MNVETIKMQMRQLKLRTLSDGFDDYLTKRKKAVDLAWLSDILQMELDGRAQNAINRRIIKAGFPEIRNLSQFNWEFNRKLPREKIEELANLKFIERNEIALFLGPPGTGKSHCAIAIGVLAAQAGHSVFCTSVKRLSQKIRIAIERETLDVLFKQILGAKLWILDDWGVVSMRREVSEEVFDLFDRRKHSSAMILTSNRDVEEWPQVFNDPVLANAAIDRMFENSNIIIYDGPSYRMRGRIIFKEFDSNED